MVVTHRAARSPASLACSGTGGRGTNTSRTRWLAGSHFRPCMSAASHRNISLSETRLYHMTRTTVEESRGCVLPRCTSYLVGYTLLVGMPLDDATSRYSRVMKLLQPGVGGRQARERCVGIGAARKRDVPGRLTEVGRLRHLRPHARACVGFRPWVRKA